MASSDPSSQSLSPSHLIEDSRHCPSELQENWNKTIVLLGNFTLKEPQGEVLHLIKMQYEHKKKTYEQWIYFTDEKNNQNWTKF